MNIYIFWMNRQSIRNKNNMHLQNKYNRKNVNY